MISRERKLPVELDARRVEVRHVLVDAAALGAERHDRADVLGRRHDARLDVRLLDAVDHAGVRQLRRALEQLHRAVGVVDVVLDVRHRRHEVQIELALEPLLDDLHVQQTRESRSGSRSRAPSTFPARSAGKRR